jgi:Uma2 family endonuclease
VASSAYELTVVPRNAVALPLPIPEPEGFDPSRPESWPVVPGRLEYVEGRLLFMPPCGDQQLKTAADVVTELNLWRRQHPEFVVGGNEAGMLLAGEVRAADAAVWRSSDLGLDTGGLPRVAPILAVEVAGKDEGEEELSHKARWYLDRGVNVVWILFPAERAARVVTTGAVTDLGRDDRIPPHPSLPGLAPRVVDLFQQLTG